MPISFTLCHTYLLLVLLELQEDSSVEEDDEVVEVVLFLLVVELAVEGLEAIEAALEAMSEAVGKRNKNLV